MFGNVPAAKWLDGLDTFGYVLKPVRVHVASAVGLLIGTSDPVDATVDTL